MAGKNKNRSVKTNEMSNWQYFLRHKGLYFMVLPGVIYFIMFRYVPMGGLVIAFKDYSPFKGIWGSAWVGLLQFKKFFDTPDFFRLLRNTLGISILQLIAFFPMPIILSLFLNEIRHSAYKRTIQTLVYIPHFVSWVIIASLTYQLFNVKDGAVNLIFQNITGHSFDILSKSSSFWGMIVGQDIWRETGYGTIIFLAALAGVDQEMYEAARMDGAGRFKLMWHITLPSIKSTVIMMLILRVGGLLNTGYEQIFLMRNDLNMSMADVFDTYIFTRGITNGQYSFSAAAGMFKSVVGMVLVLGSDRIAKRFGESGLY